MIQKSWQPPNIVVCSVSTRLFMLIELTVLYKLRMEGQHLYKLAKYEGLFVDLRDDGYTLSDFAP